MAGSSAVAALVLIIFLSAPGASHGSAPGKKIYRETCQVCHGEKGDGQTFAANVLFPPPRDFTSPASKKELSRERMIRSVTQGRPKTAMAPWKTRLTPEEIRAVVAHIRKGFMGLEE